MFGEILQAVFTGMSIGFQTFFGMLQLYEKLSSAKEELISAATGIPVVVVSALFLLHTIINFKVSKKN